MTVIYGGNPVQHNNRIHDNNQDGVHVYEAGKGTLKGNDIFANAYHGVEIREGGHPTVRDNRINKNQQWAVRVYEQSSGTVEGNDLSGNASGALSVSDDSESNLIRNNNKT